MSEHSENPRSTLREAGGLKIRRRQLLQTMVGATGLLAVSPLLAASVDDNSTPVETSGLNLGPKLGLKLGQVELRFVDSTTVAGLVVLGQATLVNRSEVEVVVTNIEPAVIETDNGRYDLSAYLAENPLRLAGGEQHHFWLRPIGDAAARPAGSVPMHGNFPVKSSQRTRAALSVDSPRYGSARQTRSIVLQLAATGTA